MCDLNLNENTEKLVLELMELKTRREDLDGITPNILIRSIIYKEIRLVKDDNPTSEEIQERNLNRVKALRSSAKIYCPKVHKEVDTNLLGCLLSCNFGHMQECHYPYGCSSQYCNQYREEREAQELELLEGVEEF